MSFLRKLDYQPTYPLFMDNLLTTPEQTALAIRMARVHTPEHQIALMLGLPLRKLLLLHGPSMQRAIISADLEIRETLFAMAKSGKNTAATIYWLKTYTGSSAQNKSSAKKTTSKWTYPTEMPPYGAVRLVGPNGEIVP